MITRSLIVRTLSVTILLAATACGSGPDTNADSGTGPAPNETPERSPGKPSPGKPSPEDSLDPPDPSDPPTPREPDPADPAELIGIQWVEPRPDRSGGEDALEVHYQLPTPCSPGLRRAEVEETASTVTIFLHREPESKKDDSMECAQVIVEESTTVTLDRPVGDRTVVDASSDERVRVGQ